MPGALNAFSSSGLSTCQPLCPAAVFHTCQMTGPSPSQISRACDVENHEL